MLGQGADEAPITDGEDILGAAYVYEQFLPDEDLEDSAKRPGSLYDSPAETGQATRALSTGDIRSLIQPVEMALEGNLDIRERDRNFLKQRLGWIEEELRRGQALDGERLRGDMIYVRDAAPDLWDVLVWNLRDAGELLPVLAQSVLVELAGPAQRRATAEG
jgi:glutathione S-transferase